MHVDLGGPRRLKCLHFQHPSSIAKPLLVGFQTRKVTSCMQSMVDDHDKK
jgi:hypothetical protein